MSKIAVDLHNLSKVYGSGELAVKAVDGVSLHIPEGEITAIMGPSGSGKTTLLQMIGALLKPTLGRVVVAGRDFAGLRDVELSAVRLHTFGFIFQSPNLLASLTATENVEVVMNLAGQRGAKAKLRSEEILKEMHLENRLRHTPAKLSGGEQQRVAIARALANDPQILLADEPTANLDSKTGHEVMELLRTIAKEQGKTVVIVSHDSRIRDVVDRVLWLEDGHLEVRWHDGAIIDPVCLMLIGEKDIFASITYDGQKYSLCSPKCTNEFQREPEKFVNKRLPDTGFKNKEG